MTDPTTTGGERRARPKKYYRIRRLAIYSLRQAEVALNLSEGQLRRAIVLDYLPAIDAADDRQYLIEGSTLQTYVRRIRPAEDCVFPTNNGLYWWSM